MTEPSPALTASYRRCRAITRKHGTTYYWATCVLAGAQRPHVHAVYAFCRVADDVVDDLGDVPLAERQRVLAEFGDTFRRDLAAGRSGHPILAAVVDTAVACRIDPECFDRFLRSMAMDFERASYETWDDLLGYMDGSAAVIGEMMLPVLAPRPHDDVFEGARALGNAFQLTNFLRDVGEDLDRGRVYVPQADLRRFGADPRTREVTPAWRRLMRFEFERCRELYEQADAAIERLPSRSRRCMAVARVLYSRILDRIEDNDFDVFTRRARVPFGEKLATAGLVAAGRAPLTEPASAARATG